jgi:hypothetical protein
LDKNGGGFNPASRRLEQNLREHDARGERGIALAQGAICCFILILHGVARYKAGLTVVHSWIMVSLAVLVASSVLRWALAGARTLPERALDVLNVVDIGIFLSLLWSYQ